MLEKTFLFLNSMGILHMTLGHVIMICIALTLLYLGIAKKYEPLLLVPIGFGMLLINLPLTGLMAPPVLEIGENSIHTEKIGGLLYYLFQGDELGIFPPLIFMGVGAMTDFGPLIADPRSILLGRQPSLASSPLFSGPSFWATPFRKRPVSGLLEGRTGRRLFI